MFTSIPDIRHAPYGGVQLYLLLMWQLFQGEKHLLTTGSTDLRTLSTFLKHGADATLGNSVQTSHKCLVQDPLVAPVSLSLALRNKLNVARLLIISISNILLRNYIFEQLFCLVEFLSYYFLGRS